MNVGLSILLSGVRGLIDGPGPNILTLLTCRQPPHRRRLGTSVWWHSVTLFTNVLAISSEQNCIGNHTFQPEKIAKLSIRKKEVRPFCFDTNVSVVWQVRGSVPVIIISFTRRHTSDNYRVAPFIQPISHLSHPACCGTWKIICIYFCIELNGFRRYLNWPSLWQKWQIVFNFMAQISYFWNPCKNMTKSQKSVNPKASPLVLWNDPSVKLYNHGEGPY